MAPTKGADAYRYSNHYYEPDPSDPRTDPAGAGVGSDEKALAPTILNER